MNVEVPCRRCRTTYLLDSAFAGAALPCPACGAPDGLAVGALSRAVPRPVPEAPVARPVAVRTPQTEPAARSQAVVAQATRPVPAPAPTPKGEEPEEIVCPRCKLHFVPRRTAGDTDRAARPIVLVVEDMEYFRQAAAEALGARCEVRQASNVGEARAQLAAGAIDLMVLDLTLDGGERGVDLLRGLRRKPCPILIYTDQDESTMYGRKWEELQRLGADDILMKGMNAGEALRRKVGGMLGLVWEDDE